MNEDILLFRRNIEAMNVAMKHFEAMRSEDKARVMQLQETVTMQQQAIQQLQTQVAIMRVKLMGNGATA
jgi:hypothetical protein